MTDEPDRGPAADAIAPELREALAALGAALDGRADHGDLARRYEWLIDALVMRGQLPASFRRLAARSVPPRSSVQLAMFRDKYALPPQDIDCAARLHLCHARCCRFEVTLSAQDVLEGKLPFELDRPYMMPKEPGSGRCVCMGADGACTVYAHRPGTCRAYDCRGDRRIWLDFEARIPAPGVGPAPPAAGPAPAPPAPTSDEPT